MDSLILKGNNISYYLFVVYTKFSYFCWMKKTYIVKKPFSFGGRRYFLGEVIPNKKIPYLPNEIVNKNIWIRDYFEVEFAITYGLISKSKEIKFPQSECEETYSQMRDRLLCEVIECKTKDPEKIFELAFDKFFE